MAAIPERIKRLVQQRWIAHIMRAVQRYLGRPMEPFTARTLVSADALLDRMRAIRRDGYTWALEEFDEGISSVAFRSAA